MNRMKMIFSEIKNVSYHFFLRVDDCLQWIKYDDEII